MVHPELVKEMSLFMFTERVDPDEVSVLKEAVCGMRADVAAALSETASYKSKHDDLSKRLGDLIAAFNTFKAENKKAAKKP
jgi:hypothetical protein